MGRARLRVDVAGPLVTFQDGGRAGHMRFGVPSSGPMDRLSHAVANVVVGNEADATAIEVSMAGIVFECLSGPVTVAVTGGAFTVDHAGRTRTSWNVMTIDAGQRLAVRAGAWGSWAYVAVAGRLDVPHWLGHTATHSMSGFGGGTLDAAQHIDVVDARADVEADGEIPFPEFARPGGRARVVMGPQEQHFTGEALAAFRDTPYVLTDAYDRMGVRLGGAPLPLRGAMSIPSEPIVRGSVQVAGDGVPTLLFADHQTTGGYPKIATVISTDIDGLAQLRAGDTVRFEPVEPDEAISQVRARTARVAQYLDEVSESGRHLTRRLRAENLIGGAVSHDDIEPDA